MLTPEEEAHKARLLAEVKQLEEDARNRYVQEARSRTYSFQEIERPEYLESARRFQEIFGQYIPDVRDSEHATIVLHQKMMDGIFGNPTETIRHSTFDADLKRLRKAVQTIAEHPLGYWQQVSFMSFNSDPEDKIARGAREIFDMILSVQEFVDDGLLPKILNKYEAWAREAASTIPDRRNINWEAVHAVERLRAYWEAWAEIPAPRRGLNPASPFANYLRDAFDFFGIEGDPIAAFRRWVALDQGEAEADK